MHSYLHPFTHNASNWCLSARLQYLSIFITTQYCSRWVNASQSLVWLQLPIHIMEISRIDINDLALMNVYRIATCRVCRGLEERKLFISTALESKYALNNNAAIFIRSSLSHNMILIFREKKGNFVPRSSSLFSLYNWHQYFIVKRRCRLHINLMTNAVVHLSHAQSKEPDSWRSWAHPPTCHSVYKVGACAGHNRVQYKPVQAVF